MDDAPIFDDATKSEILIRFHDELKESWIKSSEKIDKDFMNYLTDDFWQWIDDNINEWISEHNK